MSELRETLLAALADDFNTPRALAAVHELVGEINRRSPAGGHETLIEMLDVLGLGGLAGSGGEGPPPEAEALLTERNSARADRDFTRADEIREELAALGWEVRDTAEGARLVPRAG